MVRAKLKRYTIYISFIKYIIKSIILCFNNPLKIIGQKGGSGEEISDLGLDIFIKNLVKKGYFMGSQDKNFSFDGIDFGFNVELTHKVDDVNFCLFFVDF